MKNLDWATRAIENHQDLLGSIKLELRDKFWMLGCEVAANSWMADPKQTRQHLVEIHITRG
jgi:hypothetical protein